MRPSNAANMIIAFIPDPLIFAPLESPIFNATEDQKICHPLLFVATRLAELG